jgi:hypothetical protein
MLYIKGSTHHSRRVAATSFILGRRTGSSCQHRTVVSQTESVKSCSFGRSGRSPSMIFETATRSVNSGNGYVPVKTLGRVLYQEDQQSLHHRRWARKGKRADLYHNHAKSVDVRRLCASFVSLDDFWCSPPWRKPLHFGYKDRIQSTSN